MKKRESAMNEPTIKQGYKCTYHRDQTVSYWSVQLQQWRRTSAYELTCRHDDFAALNESERRRVSRMAIGRQDG